MKPKVFSFSVNLPLYILISKAGKKHAACYAWDYTGHGIGNADGIGNQANAECRRHWEDGIRRHGK